MTEDEAREETARWTMPPGCSEHETGLAVDIVATDNQRLDDTQEQTPGRSGCMKTAGASASSFAIPRGRRT